MTPTRSAISVFDTPSAANNTIRARCAKPARIELDRVQDSNSSRSPVSAAEVTASLADALEELYRLQRSSIVGS